MSLFDSLCDAAELIQEWEKREVERKPVPRKLADFTGEPWDDLRRIKVEMSILCIKRAYPYPILTDAEYDEIREGALKEVAKRLPTQFDKAFENYMKRFWKEHFHTEEAWTARCRQMGETVSQAKNESCS